MSTEMLIVGRMATPAHVHRHGSRRKSSVNGNSGLRSSGGTAIRPGVWPILAESSQTAALRFICVHRKLFVGPAAGMGHVIRAAPDCTPRPCVHDIKHQWRVNRDVGVQTGGRLPRAVPHASHEFAWCARGMQRNAAAVAQHDKARVDHSRNLHLQSLHRGIHVAGRAAGRRLFAQHVPGLQRAAEFQMNAALRDGTDGRESELEVRREPFLLERITGVVQFFEHVFQIALDEVRQHEAVMQRRSPGHEFSGRLYPRVAARSARSTPAPAIAGSGSCARAAAFRKRAIPPGRGARKPNRADRACRCRVRCDGCCR